MCDEGVGVLKQVKKLLLISNYKRMNVTENVDKRKTAHGAEYTKEVRAALKLPLLKKHLSLELMQVFRITVGMSALEANRPPHSDPEFVFNSDMVQAELPYKSWEIQKQGLMYENICCALIKVVFKLCVPLADLVLK